LLILTFGMCILNMRIGQLQSKLYNQGIGFLTGISLPDMLLIGERRLTARDLAKFVGRAVSMERALGCIVRLMSWSAAHLCAAAPHWEARVQLDELVVREMRFLCERAHYFNGQSIIWGASSGALQCFSDASDTGYGAYVVAPSVLSARGLWSLVDSQRSSTWRELAAVQRGLVALRCQLVGRSLQWHAITLRILYYGNNN